MRMPSWASFSAFFDPLHLREEEVFEKLGYIDIQNLAPNIRAEVLWATALCDQSCPPFSQFATYNKIKSPKRIVIYPEYGHEWLPDWDTLGLQFVLGMKV